MNIAYYATPKTVAEALGALAELDGRGMIIAGGTDLVPLMKQNRVDARALIDISGVAEIGGLAFEPEALTIGAAATHHQVCSEPRIREIWPALADACASIGSPQIRNIATLTGNVVNAQPAADAAIALVALGARMEFMAAGELKTELIEKLYAGLGRSKIDPRKEMVTAIKVPRPAGRHGNAYGRISPRNSFCMPIVNAAAALDCEGDRIVSARLAMGPVAETPFRPQRAEAELQNVDLGDTRALEAAAVLASQEANPRSSCLRGCADYRKELSRVLVKRVLEKAAAMAGRESIQT